MIRMNDFSREPQELIRKELEALERVIRSGRYVLGEEVKAFESRWAARCGTTYAVGTGNGMDAIEIGLRALGIGSGDEVITTPMTAFATVLAIIKAGAEPVLADIDTDTALLDLQSVERCLSTRTKAILLVHLYGQVRDMEGWKSLCERVGIHLLEDCAQSHAAEWGGKIAGSFGAWGAYSFYPTKNLGGIGDGGALVTNSEMVAGKAAALRNYGQSCLYDHTEIGLNSRLDEVQAAVLSVRLQRLDDFTERRKQIAEAYSGNIANTLISVPAAPPERRSHVYHLYVLRCNERDRLARHLENRGVSTLVHYPIPIQCQRACSGVRIDPYGLPRAELHAATCLSVPCHPQMSDTDVIGVIEALNDFK